MVGFIRKNLVIESLSGDFRARDQGVRPQYVRAPNKKEIL